MGTHCDRGTLPGVIGLCLTSILWLFSSWRLIYHSFLRQYHWTSERADSRQRSEESTRRSSRSSAFHWFTRKQTFHALLWLATTCEALAYADLAGILSIHRDPLFAEKLAFVLLDVTGRSILELLAFSTITSIWLKTAIESSPSVLWGSQRTPFGFLPGIFFVSTLVLVFGSAILSIIALLVYQADSLAFIETHPWGRAQVLMEATAWLLHALVVLECLIVTSKRVLHLIAPMTQWPQRLSLLSKAVLPMLVAALVYFLRFGWLVAIFVGIPEWVQRETWAWYIGFAWIPTCLAAAVLLYSARKRDHHQMVRMSHGNGNNFNFDDDYDDEDDDDLQRPLVPPTRRPPAEAFLSFSRHRQGGGTDMNEDTPSGGRGENPEDSSSFTLMESP